MKKRTPFYILASIFILFLSQKNIGQTISKTEHFKVIKATYSTSKETNSIVLSILIDNPKIKLDSIYFRNNVTKLNRTKNNSFEGKHILNRKKDLILDSNLKKEYGNQPPDLSEKIPFNLNLNEAIVSYNIKGKRFYKKIIGLNEIKN